VGDVEYLFKVVLVGDEGPARRKVLDLYAEDVFEGDYPATMGTDIYSFIRNVDEKRVKVVLWAIHNRTENKLRKAYYQEASMAIITIENLGRDSHPKYEDIGNKLFSVTRRIPIALVTGQSLTQDNEDSLRELAEKMDASQLILNLDDLHQLDLKMIRLMMKHIPK
jgi:Ras-related protein Rab-11A